jgi:hypothetical protein
MNDDHDLQDLQYYTVYPLQIFFYQICVPYCFSLTQRIFVAQMDMSLQGSDENFTKEDHLRYSLLYFII